MNFILLEGRVFNNMETWQKLNHKLNKINSDGNMITCEELNENLNKINWNELNEDKEFNADLCNEIAHDAVAKKERNLVMTLIRSAAESGCFRTILPRCHSDTMKWLEDLGFEVYYQGQTEVSWED